MTEIKHPEWLTLEAGGETVLGYNQEWYPENRQKMAGCGPTVGAMMAAYVECKARSLPGRNQKEALSIMLDMWKYATPRMHGLYKTRWLKEGVAEYLAERNLPGRVEALSVPSIRLLAPRLSKAAQFIKEGLAADCPVGFLNLHSGDEPIPYHWHWMPIVRIDEREDGVFCTLWDEGKPHEFELGRWLAKTKFGGGFVRISNQG